MFWNIKKFNKEISALKSAASRREISGSSGLHPLRKSQLKQEIFSKLENAGATATETIADPKRYTWHERKNHMIKYIVSTLLGLSLVGGAVSAASLNKKP